MSQSAKFEITYGGPALDDGLMDVQDLAPALLAVGAACTRANRVLNGKQADVQVRVNAGFKRGSFTVVIDLFQLLANESLIETVSNANQILQFAGYGSIVGMSAIGIIKKFRGKKPEKIEAEPAGGISITFNGCTFNTTQQAFDLSQDKQFRGAVRKSLAPLQREGVDFARIGDDEYNEVLTEDDYDSFLEEGAPDEELMVENTLEAVYEVVTPQLKAGYKWRLNSGAGTITATMEDEDFTRKVANREIAFHSGDILRVRICQKAWRKKGGGLRLENTILEVLELITPQDPPELFND